jgi:hypothetical protein
MNIHPSYHRNLFDSKICQVIKSRNDLMIKRIDYLKDTRKGRLVIFLESDLLFEPEINASIRGNNLIIEASRSLNYEKPIKTHLIDREILLEQEIGGLAIGFSEVKLDHGFRYSILSCQMINAGLLKVVLSIHSQKNSIN